MCSACLLSAGAATQPVQPAGAGVAALPCTLGDYRLLRKLGAGGMGIVYEADHIPTGRRLALKVLSQSLDNEEQRQRFLREGRLAATIDHPNSVYVFGTEEIDGLPVIAMELAAGGTLRDEVKRRGPLPVRDAVDAILGIIEGLEAAHARGILHRDMKPSNCFLTGEGKAMVGDYGLSISQASPPPDDEPVTRSGMVMGTPAFSPPEQLRAQPLDQRADIYSTGGTLYYLLTGKAPVERTTPVETVAAVLEGRVPNVRTARPEVSDDLAAVVARCLAPQAAARFGSYAELRAALVPFSSTAPEPAPLGTRFVAGLADGVLLGGLMFLVLVLWPQWGQAVSDEFATMSEWAFTAFGIVFHAVAESRWGATPGKWLFGLRVAGLDGARPRWHRAAVRAAIFSITAVVVEWILTLLGLTTETDESMMSSILVIAALLFAGASPLLFFIPALRRPDRAAVHDLLTGVRVILRPRGNERLKVAGLPLAVLSRGPETWGPFQPGPVIGEGLRQGHDPLLRRPVLLQARHGQAGPAAARRDCARGGRLRWLQSVSDAAGGAWDVWQAPAGSPLLTVLAEGAPRWSQVLFWLDDLAAELSAAEKDGTLPAQLSTAHIWITTDGRAVLLDEAWPGLNVGAIATTDPNASAQQLLSQVGGLCPAVHRPLHADALLTSLAQAAFERLSHMSGNIKHLLQKKMDVSRLSRSATIVGPLVAALGVPAFALLMIDAVQKMEWEAAFPGVIPLPKVLDMEDRASRDGRWKDAALAGQIRIHIAGHYDSLRDEAREDLPILAPSSLQKLRKILKDQPMPDAAGLAAADVAVRKAAPAFPYAGYAPGVDWEKAVPAIVLILLIAAALVQLLQVAVFGAPPLMRLTGVAAVTEHQRPAGRLRMLWRWCVGWAPLWLVGAVLGICAAAGMRIMPVLPEICQVWMPALLLLIIFALLVPRRSLADRLAGTWLVAR
ncbi:protein kinase domain-containing protein [Prosthecobacter sp.]